MLSTHGRHAGGVAGALLLALLVLIGSAASRGTEFDEGYSIFIAAGTPRPVWPAGVFTAKDVRPFYSGHSTMASIDYDLRHTDVHPPLYFWSVAGWRAVFGTGLFRMRLLSVLFSIIALAGVAALARRCGVPPVASILLTVGCYGFTYTGSIARGFALAQLCMIWGTVLVVLAGQAIRTRRGAAFGFAGGIVLGLASFSNYLAILGGAAALLWLLLTRLRDWPRWLAAGIGLAAILPFDFYFFMAQRSSRNGQFPPFRLLPSLVRLGKYAAANVFGGLPLYVGPGFGVVLGAVLVLALLGLFALVAWQWRRIATKPARLLLALATVAPPAGLLLLGIILDNTPIELRYIAFATPFLAVLLAGAFAKLPGRAGIVALCLLLCVQAVSLAGMMTRPETMQPQAQAARAARRLANGNGVALVPFGKDGVGVLAAFVNESPDTVRIARIDPGASAAAIRAAASGASRVVIVLLGLDDDSKSVLPTMRQAFERNPCWRQAGTGFDTVAYDRVACRS